MIKVEDNRTVSVPSDENWDNLKWLAKLPISKLGTDDGGSLLIFPQSFGEYGDKIGDEYIFSIKEEIPEMELVAYEPEDVRKLIDFMVNQ